MALALLQHKSTTLVFTDGGISLKMQARRGRNQQGLCFVKNDEIDSSVVTCELTCGASSVFSDIKHSEKVPEGIIVLDARIYDMLNCQSDDDVSVTQLSTKLPTCTEIHLDVISQRDLHNHKVAQAISKRIDDFKDHFDGLILHVNQEFNVSELGVGFVVRSMSPVDPETDAARISWNNLLKIHLGAEEGQPSNLCIIVEVAAATQIADVRLASDGSQMTRHQAILHSLDYIERSIRGHSVNTLFTGAVFSDDVIPFITFDSQTGKETEISLLHSSSLIGVFRKWVDTSLDEFVNRPSNPGAAIQHAFERAQSMSETNGMPTIVVLFSTGVQSAGRNPVKVVRTGLGEHIVRILSISVGEESVTDIMDAIAKEGNGRSVHLDSDEKITLIVKAINEMTTGSG